jgi:oxygen-independent coproporphyrinogen-3 oxidase
LPLEPACETTLEANPGTFERERFRAFAQAGVNRLSIGVQSFDDALLERIGRVHDGSQARAAAQEARESFERFNLDLMYALPQQTLEEAQNDVRTACSLGPSHISYYQLTLDPNTRNLTARPDDDLASDMLDAIADALTVPALVMKRPPRAARREAHNMNT